MPLNLSADFAAPTAGTSTPSAGGAPIKSSGLNLSADFANPKNVATSTKEMLPSVVSSMVKNTLSIDTSKLFSKTNSLASMPITGLSLKTPLDTTNESTPSTLPAHPKMSDRESAAEYNLPNNPVGQTISSAPKQSVWDKISSSVSNLFQGEDPQRGAMATVVQKTVVDNALIDTAKQLKIYDQFKPTVSSGSTIIDTYNQNKAVADYMRANYDKIKGSLTDPSALPEHAEMLGPIMSDVTKNLDAYTKALGVRSTPTNQEVISTVLTLPVAASLLSPTVAGIVTLAAFTAFGAAEHYFLGDTVANKVSDALGVNGGTRDILNLIELFGVGKALHSIYMKVPEVAIKMTKDIVTTYRPGKTVFFDPEKVKDIWATGKLLTESEKNSILQVIPGDKKTAFKNGVTVNIPPEKIVTLVDKPYWAKIKGLLNISSVPQEIVSPIGKATVGAEQRTSHLLGEGLSKTDAISKTLMEEINTNLDEHGPALTVEALKDNLGVDTPTAEKLIQITQQKTALENPVEATKLPESIVSKTIPNIDTTKHIPFAAGTSTNGKTVYIDSRIPEIITMKNGQTVNVHEALATHEIAEKKAMDSGMSYAEAHKTVGIPAEDAYLKAHGIDSKEYNDTLGPLIKETETKTHTDIPKDLNKQPYVESGKSNLIKKSPQGKKPTFTIKPSEEKPVEVHPEGTGTKYKENQIKLNGEMVKVPEKLVTKSGVKDLLEGIGKTSIHMKVNKDGNLTYSDKKSEFTLKPEAFGINTDQIKPGDTVAINEADLKGKGSNFRLYDNKGMQAGFINPGEIVESIKKVVEKTNDYIEQTNANIKISKNLDDTLFTAQKNNEADTIQNHQLLNSTKDITQEERAHILDFRDKSEAGLPTSELTEKEKQINDNIISPLYKDAAEKAAYIKDAGVPFTFDENYSHRITKNKGGPLDKLLSQKDKIFPKGGVGGNKNVLKKSAPALKHREMFAATNLKTGERTVVHIPGNKEGNITGFKNKKPISLGQKKSFTTPRTKEFFDKQVTPILEKVAGSLGITHIVENIKGNKAGVSLTGKNIVKTHPGAPERTLIHEIGHQVDEKFGMQEIFSKDDARNYGRDTMKEEQRALADLRIGDSSVPESFKKYVRKGEEKMAVMFEAYLHVPEQFQEVAPNLYEKFDEFLKNHAELAPLRNIEPSLELGLKKTGGEHIAGLKGKTFVSQQGDKYHIGQATINEIEQHSNVEYFHDPIVSAIFAHDDITRAFRAVQILESLKNDPRFTERTFKLSEGLKPEGYQTVDGLDQFRGYAFEAQTAKVLRAYVQDIKNGNPNVAIAGLSAINNFLINVMFMSPIIHPLRVASSAFINRGVANINPLTYPRAIKAGLESIISVATQNEDYLKILRSGVPTMSAKIDTAKYKQNILDSLGEKTDEFTRIGRKVIKIAGAITPFHWAHALTWPGNDMITHQQVREELAKAGLTVKTATLEQIFDISTAKVFTVLPSYRLPATVRQVPKYVTKNTLLFASYRYNLIRTFVELGHSLLTGNEPGRENIGSSAAKARYDAVGKLIMMAILTWIITPYVDDKLKKITGNNNAYLTDLGEVSVINNANKLLNREINLTQYVQTMVDLPPGTKELLQQFGSGTDWFTGTKIVAQGSSLGSEIKQRIAHMGTEITPLDTTQKIQGGKMTWGQLIEAQFGIHTPKGNSLVNILQGSNAPVIDEVERLLKTATPPSSSNIESRPDVQIFKSQVTPEKYTEAMKQFSGLYIANMAKLMNNEYRVPATATKMSYIFKFKEATDDQKSNMIDTVKNQTLASVEKAYKYNKGTGVAGKAVFEGQTSKAGIPSIANLSRASADDGTIEGKNVKGEPIYKRFSLTESSKIKENLYNEDTYWKDNGYNIGDTQLDHIVPIEAGGTMSMNNLMLISDMSDQLNQAFEDYLGSKYKAGTISRADAIRASVDYKINKTVTLNDIKNGKY